MSRVKHPQNLNATPLFPFVAVLLCTMGSLLVLLVAVARSSRDHALEQVSAQRTAELSTPKADDEDVRQELNRIKAYVAQLGTVRSQAAQQLHEDQLRLSHMEDHMRRLQDRLESLRLAAIELNSMEKGHHDDREQAEHEVERLQQLIADSRQAIDQLRAEVGSKPGSFAIVPYEGPNGTHRPPIFIECLAAEAVLQPEGIRLTPDDFAGPAELGNPLATALRAAREFAVAKNANGLNAEAEPYPLLIVRPGGNLMFVKVTQVIEHCGFDFGYELVDTDWKIKYPPASPELAALETRAIELARARMQVLASAAPRAFENDGEGAYYAVDESDEGDYGGSTGGDSDTSEPNTGHAGTVIAIDAEPVAGRELGKTEAGTVGSGSDSNRNVLREPGPRWSTLSSGGGGTNLGQYVDAPGESAGGAGGLAGTERGTNGPTGTDSGTGGPAGDGTGTGQSGNSAGPSDSGTGGLGSNDSVTGGLAGGSVPSSNNQNGTAAANGPGGSVTGPSGRLADTSSGLMKDIVPPTRADTPAVSISAPGGSTTTGASSDREMAGAPNDAANGVQVNHQLNSEPPSPNDPRHKPLHVHGNDWAITKGPGSVPIRRTIRVVVRGDRLAILPESAASAGMDSGKEIPLTGSTAAALNDFTDELHDRVKDWGMAGRGLYWRPVLELTVGPDGQKRADDLKRLLKNSGIELRTATAAKQTEGTESSAAR